jgi:acyl-CoA oxidase
MPSAGFKAVMTAAVDRESVMQVIDYENTAAALFPRIASAYVIRSMGQSLWAAYKSFEKSRAVGNFESLPELHALSAGLKAVVTEVTADGIEACRRTCGGHGYSVLSGLPSLFASYVQNCTWEGDNNVLLLQVCSCLYVLQVCSCLYVLQVCSFECF